MSGATFYSGFQMNKHILGWRSLWSAVACNRFGSQLLHSSLTGQLSNSSNHGGGGSPLGEFQRKSRIKGLTTKAVASNRTPKCSAILNPTYSSENRSKTMKADNRQQAVRLNCGSNSNEPPTACCLLIF